MSLWQWLSGQKQTQSDPSPRPDANGAEFQAIKESAIAERTREAARIETANKALEKELEEALEARRKRALREPEKHFKFEAMPHGNFLIVRGNPIPLRHVSSIVIENHGAKPHLKPDFFYFHKSLEFRFDRNPLESKARLWAIRQVSVPAPLQLEQTSAKILIETSAGRKFTVTCPDVHVETVYQQLVEVWTGESVEVAR